MFMCDVPKTTSHARKLLTVNYCLFAKGDVSIRLSGKDDKVVLEYIINVTFESVNMMFSMPF